MGQIGADAEDDDDDGDDGSDDDRHFVDDTASRSCDELGWARQ